MYSIPIYLIRQYEFCPRIVYFLEVLNIPKMSPIWVNEGNEFHIKQKQTMKRRTLYRFNLENAVYHNDVVLQDEKIGLHGVADAILETETNVFPVEYKLNGKKPMRSQIFQLYAYGILAENKFKKKFEKGFILFEKKGKTYPIDFKDNIKDNFYKTVENIKRIIENPSLPSSSASEAQCSQCEFLNYCNDRF